MVTHQWKCLGFRYYPTHAHTHAHRYSHTLTHSHTCTHSHVLHTHTLAHTFIHLHIRVRSHSVSHSHSHTITRSQSHTFTFNHMLSHTHTLTHAHPAFPCAWRPLSQGPRSSMGVACSPHCLWQDKKVKSQGWPPAALPRGPQAPACDGTSSRSGSPWEAAVP